MRGLCSLQILNAPWAITREKLEEIQTAYVAWMQGQQPDIEAIEAKLGRPLGNEQKPYAVENGVAILAVDGILSRRMNMLMEISGGTSTQMLARDFRQAMADPDAHSIVLAIDSPGGSVGGIPELAAQIFAARGQKRVVAVGDGVMASAAYYLAAAAESVFITGESTVTGSIGIIATHVDRSKRDEAAGLRVTEITAGKYKAIASEHAPLSAAGREFIQDAVDYYYSMFVNAISEYRGRSVDAVLAEMADGRTFIGNQGIKAGITDGVKTLSAVIDDLNRDFEARAKSKQKRGAYMEDKKTGADAPQVDVAAVEKVAFDRGVTEGATKERERIQAVEAQSMPGHEDLIATLKFDGKTGGPEAAVQILAAEKKKNAAKVGVLASDAPKPVAHVQAPDAEASKDPAKAATYDTKAIGDKAEAYRRAQASKGVHLTARAAVDHVMQEAGLKTGTQPIVAPHK